MRDLSMLHVKKRRSLEACTDARHNGTCYFENSCWSASRIIFSTITKRNPDGNESKERLRKTTDNHKTTYASVSRHCCISNSDAVHSKNGRKHRNAGTEQAFPCLISFTDTVIACLKELGSINLIMLPCVRECCYEPAHTPELFREQQVNAALKDAIRRVCAQGCSAAAASALKP
jgi:hypothetical protein